MRRLAIVNPAARKGGVGKDWPQIEAKMAAVDVVPEVKFTNAPGDATGLARQAAADGFDQIISVGGDGTNNEIINGLVTDDSNPTPDILFSPLPVGTGNDLCRTLGFFADDGAGYRALANGEARRIDLLKARCRAEGGGTNTRYGVLHTAFGAAGEIAYRSDRSRLLKKLVGDLSYYVVTLQVALTYRIRTIDLTIDDAPSARQMLFTGLACNNPYAGGSMFIAPDASLEDGVLDLVVFGDMPRRDILFKPPSWFRAGQHVHHPNVETVTGRRFHLDGDTTMLVTLDGETAGRLPLTVDVLPSMLQVLV